MLGLSECETKRLKDLQYEYNRRRHEMMSDREMPTMRKDAFGHDDLDGYAKELIKFCIDQMFSKIDESNKSNVRKTGLKKIFLGDLEFWADKRKEDL